MLSFLNCLLAGVCQWCVHRQSRPRYSAVASWSCVKVRSINLLESEAGGVLVDALATNTFTPVALAAACGRLAETEDLDLVTDVVGDVLAVLHEVEGAEVLRGLVDAVQLGGEVHAAALALAGRDAGAVTAADTDLPHDDLLVATLDAAVGFIKVGLEELDLLADEALVLGQGVLVAVHEEGNGVTLLRDHGSSLHAVASAHARHHAVHDGGGGGGSGKRTSAERSRKDRLLPHQQVGHHAVVHAHVGGTTTWHEVAHVTYPAVGPGREETKLLLQRQRHAVRVEVGSGKSGDIRRQSATLHATKSQQRSELVGLGFSFHHGTQGRCSRRISGEDGHMEQRRVRLRLQLRHVGGHRAALRRARRHKRWDRVEACLGDCQQRWRAAVVHHVAADEGRGRRGLDGVVMEPRVVVRSLAEVGHDGGSFVRHGHAELSVA
mmetsp:Transcript_1225/g.2902  ORF Transcript_1225/g.2902 Transcript_1225/m.2902 type:complete len:436 (+) Transcript_1225:163-1470(+)